MARKGGKSITIKSYDQEKCRISVILAIISNGSKLAPYLIFKAKQNGIIEKRLKNDKYVLSKKCFVACNINAWSTSEIIKDWKIKVWDEYLTKGSIVNDENYGYLIMDRAPSHDNEEILKLFSGGNREITLIPGGLTRYYQPLDVSVNKPFKNALREKYISYCIQNGNNDLKISRSKMIQFICEIWYDDKIITKEIIYKSFRATGIANNLNKSEDYLFTSWARMKEENPLIEDDLGNYFNLNEIDEGLENEVLDEEEI